MLVSYVRDENGNPVGTVVATLNGDEVAIGWSKLNPKDRFTKLRGQEIALGRALVGTNHKLPNGFNDAIDDMIIRAGRYFKIHPEQIVVSVGVE